MRALDPDALLAGYDGLGPDWATTSRSASGGAGGGAGRGTTPEAALALAETLPPSVAGHGGDAALFRAAREIASIVGPDEGAIFKALADGFNPRCAPAWPDAKLQREATRAAEAQADPVAAWARRRAAMREGATPSPNAAGGVGGWPAPIDWTAPLPPIEWYCRDLGIARSDAKITLIGGLAGAGKGPLANYLSVCFASGLPVFGRFSVRRAKVLILDFEGARLTARRIHSHCAGLGVDARGLQGRLVLQPATPDMISGGVDWLAERIRAEQIEVLIIDSYMSAMGEVDADPNSPQYAMLARELGRLGIVTIVIAHARKPASGTRGDRPSLGDIAGSFALGGYAQTGIAVWNPDDDNRLRTRVACMRAPEDPFGTLDLSWVKGGTDAAPSWSVAAQKVREVKAADEAEIQGRTAAAVLEVFGHNPTYPLPAKLIADLTGLSPGAVGKTLGDLQRAGVVRHQPDARGTGAGSWLLVP